MMMPAPSTATNRDPICSFVTFSPNSAMASPEITTGVRELMSEANEALEYWMPRNKAALDR